MILNAADIESMEQRRRAALVNSLSGFKSANLVGTANVRRATNLAIMSSVVHLGSHPPLLALVVRPGGEERHTLANILATGCYTINHVNSALVEAAHQTAARYPNEVSEFTATGLTPRWRDGFDAPAVEEAHVRMGLRLREHQELSINATHLVIGEVVFVELPDNSLRSDGSLDIAAADTVALAGLDSYYLTQPHKRMAYAKPDLPPREVSAQGELPAQPARGAPSVLGSS
ncbi:MAG: flavin reductase family protein [Gammaproteobacteria bacterium]|jgi:flavin reductase (DIM6/NTAB) family NADH-FMN oxidoreductase RutF|nr:flavin reductase family protein [Gammaproteobacteria bacterium]